MGLADFNVSIHPPSGIGVWRQLYVEFIKLLEPVSVIELGSGSADFLGALPNSMRRVGIDAGERFKDEFSACGAEFYVADLDHDRLPDIGTFDVVVCSDVFEHLLYPETTLNTIRSLLGEEGVALTHVPNEFHWRRTLSIMLGRSDAVYYHKGCEEWENPHLRRFTDLGFRRFLGKRFAFSLKLMDLRYGMLARTLGKIGISPPLALELGPTYASTDSERQIAKRLVKVNMRLVDVNPTSQIAGGPGGRWMRR